MIRSLLLCPLFLSALLATPPAAAQAAVGFYHLPAPEPARSWQERTRLLETAELIEMTVVARVQGKADRTLMLTGTPAGTVGCMVKDDGACGALEDLGIDVPVGLLLDLLVANVPQSASSDPTSQIDWSYTEASSPLGRQSIHSVFSQWSFNPEAGLRMPGQITLTQEGKAVDFQVERFWMIRDGDSDRLDDNGCVL